MEAAKSNGVLRKGDRVVVVNGPHANTYATVVDPVAVPDKDADGNDNVNRRKVLILTEGDDFELYILPRQLDLAEIQHHTHQEHNMPTETAAVVDSMDVAHSPERPHIQFQKFTEVKHITDPMDPALDQFRPNANIVDNYINRTLAGDYKDTDFLLHMRDQRDENGYSPNIALVGPTQAGKTLLVQVLAVLAAEKDGHPKPYPVFTLNGSSGISNYDLYGKTTAVIIDGVEVLVWMDGVCPMAARCGGILYLDEWNAVPPTQAVGLHPLLDDRRQFTNTHRAVPDGHGNFMPEVVKANTNLWVISTINPVGYKGTQAMAEATSNRFRWYEWGYDTKVEKQILTSDAVIDFAKLLRDACEGGAIKTPVGTSALYRLNEDLSLFGADVALWAFKGMFQTQKDLLAVEEIIQLNDIHGRLDAEYEDREIQP